MKISIIVKFIISQITSWSSNKRALTGTRNSTHKFNSLSGLVLGTGPTVGNLDWDRVSYDRRVAKLKVIGCNYLPLQPGIPPTEIDFLLLSDERTHPRHSDSRTAKLWKLLEENTNIIPITPTTWHKTLNSNYCVEPEGCLHFNDNSLEWITSNTSPLRARGYVSMTAYKAIAFAIHFGFNSIGLLGIENTWYKGLRVDHQGRIFQDSVHVGGSYSEPDEITKRFKNGVGDYFYELSIMFLSLNRAFGSQGNLVNLDMNSVIDFIPRISDSHEFKKYIRA